MTQTKLYKFKKNIDGDVNQVIKKETVNSVTIKSCIPLNPENTDYQEYLEWAKTNTAEEAD